MAKSQFQEIQALTDRWATTTYKVLHDQLRKHNIGITQELWLSLRHHLTPRHNDSTIRYDLSFLERGRFRDMGAGSQPKIERKKNRKHLLKGRKPAKWYARPFYGRLNVLQGALGYQVMEQSIKAVKDTIQNGTKKG